MSRTYFLICQSCKASIELGSFGVFGPRMFDPPKSLMFIGAHQHCPGGVLAVDDEHPLAHELGLQDSASAE